MVTPELFRRKRINLYIGNNSAPNALIRGDCKGEFLASMVRMFWNLAEDLSLDVWI